MQDFENPKLQKIYTTAKSLFWKFGIKRVSIEEICREANVSKMTFYKHFSNKVDLVKFLLDRITDEAKAKYREIMHQEIPFQEKVKQSVQLKMEQTDDVSQEFFVDIHKNAGPEILDFFNQKLQEGIQLVINDYVDAQKRGDIRPDIKPEFILYFLNQMIKMVRDESLIRLYDSPQDLIMELTNFFFYGILPRNDEEKG